MAENSGIEWTDHTFNPWQGCSKVSPVCKNCYAMELVNRYGGDFLGRRVVAAESGWKKPLKWNKQANQMVECDECRHRYILPKGMEESFCNECGNPTANTVRPRVFCASLSDVFEDWDGPIRNHKGEQLYSAWHHAQPDWVATNKPCEGDPLKMDEVRLRVFNLFAATQNLDKLVLTKRPENIPAMIERTVGIDWWKQHCASTTWLGTTVENQSQADKRIPELLKCRDLSPVLFLSCEPLLGPLCLDELLYCQECYGTRLQNDGPQGIEKDCDQCDGRPLIDWVIVGGESGKEARPMNPAWAESLRDQCQAANIPFFFKQWGEWQPERRARHSDLSCDARKQLIVRQDGQLTTGFLECGKDAFVMNRVGKKRAGRLLNGKEFSQFPLVEE